MRKVLLSALVVALPWIGAAQASTVQLLPGGCGTAAPKAGQDIIYIGTDGSVCVNATVTATATTTATASATPTAVLAGTGKPLNIDLFSELFVQPSFGGTPVDLTHGLPVNIVGGAGGGASAVDEATFTQGTTSYTPIGGIYTTSPVSLTSGQAGVSRLTADRMLFVNLGDVNGAPSSLTNPLFVSPVTGAIFASSQSGAWTVAATESGTWNITNISGTISLPTGAATSALQTTGNTALTTINTTLGTPMQATGGTVGLVAGTALIGKFGIDQTTPGTTNAVATSPGARTLVTLDVKTVTTGGTAVTALTSGHKTAGGWLQNPVGATINLCINEISTATGTTSSGDTTCIIPGQTYSLVPSSGAVSVITSDSSHPFSGYGFQ